MGTLLRFRSLPAFAVALTLLIALTPSGAREIHAQSGSASGTFDTSVAAVGITEVLENRITITRDGNALQADIAVTVITEGEGPIVGSLCRTEYTQRFAAPGTVSGQSVWVFSGTFTQDWTLVSGDVAACHFGGGDTSEHNEIQFNLVAYISGTTISGFANGMPFTIADASAILD